MLLCPVHPARCATADIDAVGIAAKGVADEKGQYYLWVFMAVGQGEKLGQFTMNAWGFGGFCQEIMPQLTRFEKQTVFKSREFCKQI